MKQPAAGMLKGVLAAFTFTKDTTMKHTACEIKARAQKLQKARGREHMDRTGVDYRLMSIELWAELYQKGPRMVANYRTCRRDMEARSEFIRRINSMTYGNPTRSLPEAWRELDAIAQEEGLES